MDVVSMKEYLEFQYKFLREHVVENVYTTKMLFSMPIIFIWWC